MMQRFQSFGADSSNLIFSSTSFLKGNVMNTMNRSASTIAAVIAIVVLSNATPARAVLTNLVSVDFNNSSSPTEAGFVGQSAASATYDTFLGVSSLTATISSFQGNFDRGVPATHTTNTDLYRDFYFDNGTTLILTLSGSAIEANTDYEMTFYAFDEDQNSSVSFDGTSGTVGSAGPIVSTADADITSLGQFADTGTFTSDNAGVLTITTGNGSRPRINAFEISVDVVQPTPEPSTLILAALGLVGLMGTRRRRNR